MILKFIYNITLTFEDVVYTYVKLKNKKKIIFSNFLKLFYISSIFSTFEK